MFCSHCGKKLSNTAKFCSRCGRKTMYAVEQEQEISYQEVFTEAPIEGGRPQPIAIAGIIAAALTIIILLVSLVLTLNMVSRLNTQLQLLQNSVITQQQAPAPDTAAETPVPAE